MASPDHNASNSALIESLSTSGIAAQIPAEKREPIVAAPTTESRLNRVRLPIEPIACWSIGDARFDIGSSFIRPDIADDVRALAALLRRLQRQRGYRPLASIYGHADPVGQPGFNKQLSGRRAAALYGLLTHGPAVWEDLYSQTGRFAAPLSADTWGESALRTMLAELGYAGTDAGGATALEGFQADYGLAVDNRAGPITREALFRGYIERLARGRDGEPIKLDAADFLAAGADGQGKGDYHGCGEANPLVILSQAEWVELGAEEKIPERDAENEPNRRVLVYLFHPDDRIAPDEWPCPRTKEGDGACRKRFWSDSDRRVKPGEARREYQRSRDTFACRFYDRLTWRSPCEMTSVQGFAVYLLDPDRQRLPFAQWRVFDGDRLIAKGVANEEALAMVSLPQVPEVVRLEWRPEGSAASDDGAFPFMRPHYPLAGIDAVDTERLRMLENLALNRYGDVEADVAAFQRELNLSPTGKVADIRDLIERWHATGEAPLPAGEAPAPSSPEDDEADDDDEEIRDVVAGHADSAEDA